MDFLKAAGFDYAELARLADTDPAAFARRRAELIRAMIARANRPVDLANLQLEIDAVRFRHPPGVSSGMALMDRMLDNARRLSAYAEDIRGLVAEGKDAASDPRLT